MDHLILTSLNPSYAFSVIAALAYDTILCLAMVL
ncbi:hypothetical protein CJF30_00010487 [Rutstroemia sp. NJR-2017a BBW]|nr:hypothetical protein CJF30_00010487 [Rutstroemia sp. NJR-2017a BBW]